MIRKPDKLMTARTPYGTPATEDEPTGTPPLALDEHSAALALGVSETHLRKQRKAGHIPHVWIGKRVVYPIDGLRQWLLQAMKGPQVSSQQEMD